MSQLMVYLNTLLPKQFEWGETDCILVCADWVHHVTGIDPAVGLRMTYSSRGECQKETKFFTDPLAVIAPRMEAGAGLPPTLSPAEGDVAVVVIELDGKVAPVGAICLGAYGWAFMGERGVTIKAHGEIRQVLRAWTVGYAA